MSEASHKRAYNFIRDRILSFAFLPDSKLVETRLGEEIGVSRTPVREALRRLAEEGLVEIRPGRSAVVTPLELNDIREVYFLREVLEGEAALLALRKGNIDRSIIIELKAELEGMADLEANGETVTRLAEIDSAVHSLIVKSSNMPKLETIISHLNAQAIRMFMLGISERYPETISENLRILTALRLGEPEFARVAMRDHIRSSYDVLLQIMRDLDLSNESSAEATLKILKFDQSPGKPDSGGDG